MDVVPDRFGPVVKDDPAYLSNVARLTREFFNVLVQNRRVIPAMRVLAVTVGAGDHHLRKIVCDHIRLVLALRN